MPWNRPTLEEIYQRIVSDMESRLSDSVALLRRAVLRILAKIFAGAIHMSFGYLEWVSRQLMVDQAETEWLNRHGFMWGISRKSAAFATGGVYFTGTHGTVIPTGTRVQTPEGIEYETLAEATIAGTISNTVQAQCLTAGETGNTTSNTIQLVTPITGVDSSSAVSGFSGGVDEESDDDYRERILARIQNPPMGGTKADYEFWAKEVSGVDNAWCFPRAGGDGTVGVVIKATGSNPEPSDTLRSETYEYIYTKMPIGATLIDPTTRRVDGIDQAQVTMSIQTTPYTAEIGDQVQANLAELFEAEAAPGEDILISQVRDAIANVGVDDYTIVYITKDMAYQDVNLDIPMVGYEYAVLTNATVGAMP